MKASIFTKIGLKADKAGLVVTRTKKSHAWFIKNLKDIKNVSRKGILSDNMVKPVSKIAVGRVYMYFYDPKLKKTLPYYDRFPLIIMVGPAKGGFYGLNLHYLPLRIRAVFFDYLFDTLNNDKFDRTTKFKVTYGFLKHASKLKMFAPCFKHYLTDHIASKIVEIPPEQWEIALFLPTDSFAGDYTRNQIWNISRKSY